MTVRFVPARRRNPTMAVVRRYRTGARVWSAANDNGNHPLAANDEGLLADTLRHFGSHGLHSAQMAADRARAARGAGDESAFAHWLSICAMFDRRLAEAIRRDSQPGE
jgi:hypothetical protein